MAANWDNKTWVLDPASPPFQNDLDPPTGGENKFKLTPLREGAKIYMYKITPLAGSGAMKPFWCGCKLLPQKGRPLKMSFRKLPPHEPGDAVDMKARKHRLDQAIRKIRKNPERYERLVGFTSINGQDNPVSLYQITRGHTDGRRPFLVVDLKIVGANPSGSVSGNGF